MVDARFAQLPQSIRPHAHHTSFEGPHGRIPALLVHPTPDWVQREDAPPAPTVLWFHGRTVNKELDPGRYIRWRRSGIAACAVDLPGHGERLDEAMQDSSRTLDVVERAVEEVDAIVAALGESRFRGAFDLNRLAIGGMSAGGMVTLVRLCREHPFRCAAVEATAGNFEVMSERLWNQPERAKRLNPIGNLGQWRPVPLLALHSEADAWVPFRAMTTFLDALRDHYTMRNADPGTVELVSWPETGAPEEHMGFGRMANEAKNVQTAFFERCLE